MITSQLMRDEKILVIIPEGSLEVSDFEMLAEEVDPYIEQQGKLNGLMIYSESFPGWDSFAALLSHINFIKEHHKEIKKVAAVTDNGFLSILPRVAGHFVQAEIKHFAYHDKAAALEWFKLSSDLVAERDE